MASFPRRFNVIFCSLVFLLLGVAGCAHSNSGRSTDSNGKDSAPAAPREFRAVWVATVANIDWPSKPGLSTPEQQAEAVAILDRCKALNINAVVLQVRPGCDAMYASKIEPWSYYLTGEQGKKPDPYYDPLKFWIDQSHARGIELHAWFNPYRARHKEAAKTPQAASHISKTNPAIVKEFNGWQWLDPAEPAAQKLSYDVFMDVLKRYNVDGIHIDDYFYPYPEYLTRNGVAEDFPDGPAWERYTAAGGTLSRADWRRHNVDQLIERIYNGIKREKKWVKFGISPFGLGKPALRPEGVSGFSQYDKLYADADLWLNNGWCDYWTPQLYWPIDRKGLEFPKLVNYWIGQNKQNRHFWPGLYTSKVGEPSTQPSTRPTGWPAEEIVRQIEVTRATNGRSAGQVHFSMIGLLKNRGGIVEALQPAYATPALVPASPWLDNKPPRAPRISLNSEGKLTITAGWGEKPKAFAVWARYGDTWTFEIVATAKNGATATELPTVKNDSTLVDVCVSAVDRCGNESARVYGSR